MSVRANNPSSFAYSSLLFSSPSPVQFLTTQVDRVDPKVGQQERFSVDYLEQALQSVPGVLNVACLGQPSTMIVIDQG